VSIEFEAKILDIDLTAVTEAIVAAGGRLTHPTRLLRRHVYDIILGDMSRWIRLRDTGSEVTLTVKEIAHDGIDGTTETEVTVGDFETTNLLLGRLGFSPKSYQENRRTSFELAGARLEIDQWPMIPPYLEIEGDDRDHVVRVAALLGTDESDLTGENTVKVYARHGIDLMTHSHLSFE
jgi:adenylate cyclase class 2